MSKVYDVINKMQNVSGTNEKIAIMESIKEDPELERDFLRIVIATYSPYINFYIKHFSLHSEGIGDITDLQNLQVLENIAKRKITGNAALEQLVLMGENLSWKSQLVLTMIINKSFGSGISIKSINKVWPGKIPVFNVMLCHPLNERSIREIKFPCLVQIKYDAARVVIIVKDENVRYFTRNGKEYIINNPLLDSYFVSMGKKYINRFCDSSTSPTEGVVFDGELYKAGALRQESNGIATKLVRGTASKSDHDNVSIILWDVIKLDEFQAGKSNQGYDLRLSALRACDSDVHNNKNVNIADTKVFNNLEDIYIYNDMMISAGEEGVIIKNIKGGWEAKRSYNTIKMKEELQSELRVVKSVVGLGKYSNMCGALECESEDGKVKVSVGSGLSDDERKEFAPNKIKNSIVGQIITIKHNGLIKDKNGKHSLYLPRFIEVRFDKDTADTLQKIKSEGKRA